NESRRDSAKNSPHWKIEGVVQAVDEKTGLVTIAIPNETGISKGTMLEVYRLQPTPTYLGTIQIMEVGAKGTDGVNKKVVGKPAKAFQQKVQVGDKVTNLLHEE